MGNKVLFLATICLILSVTSIFAGGNTARAAYGAGDFLEVYFEFKPSAELVDDAFDTMGYSSAVLAQPSVSTFRSYLAYTGSFYFSGHGVLVGSDYELFVKDVDSNGVAATDGSETFGYYDILSLPYQELVVYDACNSCSGSPSLCYRTYSRGSDCVIGWDSTVTNSESACWSESFYGCVDDENDEILSCLYDAYLDCDLNSILAYSGDCDFVLTE